MSFFCNCNKCGKKINKYELENGLYFSGRLGYGSTYDGQSVEIDLCTECSDDLINSLVIPPFADKEDEQEDWYDSDFLS